MKGRSRKFGPRLTVSLTGDDYEALSVLADNDDVSRSWLIRRAIEEYLRKRRPGPERSPPPSVSKDAGVLGQSRPQTS